MILALLAATALGAAEPPSSAHVAASSPPSVDSSLKPGERRIKVVCREEVRTGTRFSRRICTPLEIYRERQRMVEETLKDMQRARRAL
jgi:hypothetical protein